MSLSEKFISAFKEMVMPFPKTIVEWFINEGISQENIGKSLSDMASELIEKKYLPEAFWVLTTFREGLDEGESNPTINKLIAIVSDQCLAICKKWPGNEFTCNAIDLNVFEKNIERNFHSLLLGNPVLLSKMINSPVDRNLSVEKIGSQIKYQAYIVRDLAREGHLIGSLNPLDKLDLGAHYAPLFSFGMGHGHLLLTAIEHTNIDFNVPNMEVGIYVFEPSVSVFKVNMAIHDWREIFDKNRIKWYLGNDGWDSFQRYFLKEYQINLGLFIHSDLLVIEKYLPKLKEITAERESIVTSGLKELTEHYSSITDDEWFNIYNGSRPLKVFMKACLFSTFQQYCIRDLADGFKQLGHKVEILIEKAPILRLTFLDEIKRLMEFKPDLIVCISHNRINVFYEATFNIPLVNWQQDFTKKTLTTETAESIKERDFIVTCSNYCLNTLHEYSYPKEKIKLFNYWPTNTTIYKKIELSKADINRYGSDISFICHGTLSPEYSFRMLYSELQKEDPLVLKSMRQYYDYIEDKFLTWEGYPLTEEEHQFIFTEILKDNSIEINDTLFSKITYHFFQMIGLYFLRQRPLEKLAEIGIDIALYGNEWEKHPRLGRFARGPAKNGEEVNIIYNASKITYHSLHVHTMHNRIMDAAAAKSFFIIKKLRKDTDCVERIFQANDDFVYFDGPNDIGDIVTYYLDHPEERNKISENAYNRVRSRSYSAFADSIKSIVAKNPVNITA